MQQIQQSSGENAVRLETVSEYLHQLQQTTLHEAQTAHVPNSPLPTPSTETCTSIMVEYILRSLVGTFFVIGVIRVGHMMLVHHFPGFM